MILNNFNKSFAIERVSNAFSLARFRPRPSPVDVLIICLETLAEKEKDSPFVILSSCSLHKFHKADIVRLARLSPFQTADN